MVQGIKQFNKGHWAGKLVPDSFLEVASIVTPGQKIITHRQHPPALQHSNKELELGLGKRCNVLYCCAYKVQRLAQGSGYGLSHDLSLPLLFHLHLMYL
jgi:hypothetical protein